MKNASSLISPVLCLALWLFGAVSGQCFFSREGPGDKLRAAGHSGTVAYCQHGFFGEVIRATVPMAKANPFRVHRKYQDETELIYYGYRYYSASTGRWLSRDPVGEKGEATLQGFAHNSPLNHYDILGLDSVEHHAPCYGKGSVEMQITVTKFSSREEMEKGGFPNAVTPGMAFASFPNEMKCEGCKDCKWKLIIKVNSVCSIGLGDESAAVFRPGPEAAERHERCHCDDYKAVMQALVDEAGAELYSSEKKCERAKRKWDTEFGRRYNEMIKTSTGHANWSRWWDERSPCFCRGKWI